MAVRVIRRTVPGKRILAQPNQTTITAIGRTWNTQRTRYLLYRGAGKDAYLGDISAEELADLEAGGYLVCTAESAENSLTGQAMREEKVFSRTDKQPIRRGPAKTSAWPYTLDEHFQLYTSSAWTKHQEWIYKLRGDGGSSNTLPMLTRSQLAYLRAYLSEHLTGKVSRKRHRPRTYIPQNLRWMLFFTSGIQFLLCSLLVQPEFAPTGEFVRFIPLDQIAARDRMLALTTSQVLDALREF